MASCCSRLAASRRLTALQPTHGDAPPRGGQALPWLQAGAVCSPPHLARFRVVVRKLKIAPSGAIPLSHSEIMLIDRL